MTEGELKPCPACDGFGWYVGEQTVCCRRAEGWCGSRGCRGPEREQAQVQCEVCGGAGQLPEQEIMNNRARKD